MSLLGQALWARSRPEQAQRYDTDQPENAEHHAPKDHTVQPTIATDPFVLSMMEATTGIEPV
jgi:hypothetical protein